MLLFQELRDKLVQHINEIGQKEGKERDRKLKELLAKSFPIVRVKALRPVVMCILRNTPHIDEKYLKVLVSDCCLTELH
jgi:negative elongation factor B